MLALCRAVPATSAAILAFESMLFMIQYDNCAPWSHHHHRVAMILTYAPYLWANVQHAMIGFCRAVPATSAAVLAFESMLFMIQYDNCAPWSHHHHRVAMILTYAPYLWANVQHAMIGFCRAVPATSAAVLAFESMSPNSTTCTRNVST